MRKLLIPFSWIFRIILFIRNYLYNNGYIKVVKLHSKVISVGNISVGGTGKTPFVEYISKYLINKGEFVIIITKGYKKESDDMQVVEMGYKNEDNKLTYENFGDESMLFLENFSDVKVGSGLLIASENKRSGAKLADSKFKPDVIIIDDGFQRRDIHRDLDIVLLNINYKGLLLPAGNFREPYSATKRAHIKIMNYKFWDERDFNLVRLGKLPSIKYVLDGFYNMKCERFEKLEKKAVFFCGIGDSKSFKKLAEESGILIDDFFEFPDHHNYEDEDLQKIIDSFNKNSSEIILTTQKDFVRFKYSNRLEKKEFVKNYPVFYAKIQLKFSQNQDILFNRIDELIKA